MERLLWYFILYSFLGFLVEVAFARAVRAEKQDRKCFYFLPLCPVYGLGALLILAPAQQLYPYPILVAVWSALAATGAEYVMSLFYEKALGVSFWDYPGVPGCLGRGRICLPFSLVWGVLSAGAAVLFQPLLAPLARRMPPVVTYGLLLLLTADAITSASALFHSRDTELLSIRRLRSQLSENREGPGSVTARDGH